MTFLTEMNAVESAITVLALFGLILWARPWISAGVSVPPDGFTYLFARLRPSWGAAGAVLAAFALLSALCLALSETSQFMTLDETAFGEVLRNPADRNIASNWSQGASHTANLIWIPVTRLMQALGASGARIDSTLKTIHWLVGAALIVGIVINVVKFTLRSIDCVLLASALTGALLVLPVSNLALKTMNYDSISLFGSLLGIFLVARGYQDRRPALVNAGLLFASLAAQEKLNASLILLILCLAAGVIKAEACDQRPVRAAMLATLRALCLALIVSACSYAIAALFLIGDPAMAALLRTAPLFTEILTIWAYVPLRFVFGIGDSLADPAARHWYAWIAVVLTLGILPLAAALLVLAKPWLSVLPRRLASVSPYLFPFGVTFVIATGILGLRTVTPFWAPMVPLDPALMTIGSMNGVQLHFGASSAALHRLAAVAFAYGALLAALPTALVVTAAITAARLVWRPRALPFFDLLFVAAILAPAILALLNAPTFNRYLNLPILMVALVVVVRAVDAWAPLIRDRRWTVLVLPVALFTMVAEVAPFRPLHGAFRPFWVEYGHADTPTPGHLNFSWNGWGEEALLAGKLLDKECRKAGSLAGVGCREIRIWPVYKARWFPRSGTRVQPLEGGFFAGEDWASGPDVYYVMNRQLFAGGLLTRFPEVDPDFTVQYRGFTIAWIFRADRLRKSGFRFVWGA